MKIKENYVPKAKRLEADKKNNSLPPYYRSGQVTQTCPKCKREIPIKEIDRHIKIELLDPKWREQKEREASKKRPSNLIVENGVNVANNLNKFAEIRKDIFGGDELEAERKIIESSEKAKLQLCKAWVGVKVDNPGAIDHESKAVRNNPFSALSQESMYNNKNK
jgi:splicing factor 3A subunit 1